MKYAIIITIVMLSSSCHRAINKLQLEQSLQSVVERKKIAGFAVSIFNKDSILFMKGYGSANVENQKPYTATTPQVIASISKMYIGIALLKCQEMGLLSLEDDINDYLPFKVINPFYPNEKITIKHLATHTATFKYSEAFTDEYNYTYSDSSLLFLTKNHFSKDGQWYSEQHFHPVKPGELWDYSNAGATLAASIIENLSGKSYDTFVKTHLFAPLQLEKTGRHIVEQNNSHHYQIQQEGDFSKVERKPMGLYPAGDYLSNAIDLTHFFQMIMNDGKWQGKTVLSEKSLNLFLAPHQKAGIDILDSDHKNHGIFLFHDFNILGMPGQVKGHIGGDTGIFTCAWFNPKTEMGYIFLSNTERQEENVGDMIFIWQSLYKYSRSLRK